MSEPLRPRYRRAAAAVAVSAAVALGIVVTAASPSDAYSEQRYVTRVLDGDTIEVAPPGQTSGPVDVIRFAGVNTNEVGMCHAAEATARTRDLVEEKWVTLSADDPGSMASDGVRFLRFVDVDGVDVGLTLLEESLAFVLPNDREPSRNQEYMEASKTASLAGQGIWDPTACGNGPNQNTPLRMIIDWDAPGNDNLPENRNGEYFRIHNDGNSDLELDGWTVRDSSTHFFPLPSNAVIPARGYITIYAGPGTSTATEVYLDHDDTLFQNEVGDGGFLLDPDDDIRVFFYYPCVLDCSDPLQGTLSITANWDAEGSDDENPNGEWIDIRNTSSETVDLFDYTLHNLNHPYDFPEGTSIPAGESLRLYIGSGTNTGSVQYWGMSEGILLNAGDRIVVETYDRIEIASFEYPCVGACTDPLQGKIDLTANYDAEGPDDQNLNGEWINITNVSTSSIDLGDYVLKSGGHTYYFDDGPIHPGERLRLFVGSGQDSRLEKYWNMSLNVLGNTVDEVFITTYDLIVIDRIEWPCSPCGPTPSLEITDWQWDVPGQDDPNDEWIQIENTGGVAVDLRDWMLRDNANGLDFEESRVLAPGQKLKVYVGRGTDTSTKMYWGLGDDILFGNDVLELWTPHRDLRSCHTWGDLSCGPVVDPPTSAGENATIVGTTGDDVLVGTPGPDVIVGLDGNDSIFGEGGNDILCGGSGRDLLVGGNGNDVFRGNGGVDTIGYSGAPSGVTVDLEAGTAEGHGSDTFTGVEGVIGSSYGDTLKGDDEDNLLDGGSGNDLLRGRAGRDELIGGDGADQIFGGKGGDSADGGAGADVIEGGTGPDTLDGAADDDVVRGKGGADVLHGSGGDDELRGAGGTNSLYGGVGTDLCRSGTMVGCEL